jgi:hypothetical protein
VVKQEIITWFLIKNVQPVLKVKPGQGLMLLVIIVLDLEILKKRCEYEKYKYCPIIKWKNLKYTPDVKMLEKIFIIPRFEKYVRNQKTR